MQKKEYLALISMALPAIQQGVLPESSSITCLDKSMLIETQRPYQQTRMAELINDKGEVFTGYGNTKKAAVLSLMNIVKEL